MEGGQGEAFEKAKGVASRVIDEAKDIGGKVSEKASEIGQKASEIGHKASELGHKATEKAQELGQKIGEKLESGYEKVKEKAGNITEDKGADVRGRWKESTESERKTYEKDLK